MSKGLMKKTALASSALCLMGGMALADQVILDDLIVDGSACIGQDCVNGESFGFDTIRIKENNLRIKADDTSVSASFPNRDWQLTFNDSSNGGANKFSVDDITGSRTPFTIEAGARTNALFIEDSGQIGIGTSTPVADLHVKTGNTPTLRLEQDGSSGFTAQTWDLAGNEANFFVRDATNGSTLPFRIRPGAPTSAIDVDGNGNVGIGTSSPEAPVHVARNNASAQILISESHANTSARTLLDLSNNGRPDILLSNTGTSKEWTIGGGTNLVFKAGAIDSLDNAKTKHFDLNGATGNLVITGTITTGGVNCGGGCDRVFDADYDLLSIDEHTYLMYKNRSLPNVGPTPENHPFNVTDKLGRILNELEHAHIYIAQLNTRISELEKQNLPN